ncbi:hypothetical protein UPYG_G00243880 [Umbra pygmaea]|uniref:SPRY-associated domain-containing protein n=1 Tax=Umbra pygmaea TaxID=75934 RepID=A0ABD0X233_UMBPY
MDHGGEWRRKSGLKKYVCDLTLDPNTVHRKLSLSEENRKVTWSEEKQSYPDHPERFEIWEQAPSTESWSVSDHSRAPVLLTGSPDTLTHLYTFITTSY